jgi:hypothetical protein
VPSLNHVEFGPSLGEIGPYMQYDTIMIVHHGIGTKLNGKDVSGL